MASGGSSNLGKKRAAAEALIKQYFVQLTEGCHKEGCSNSMCATGSGKPVEKNKAAGLAVKLVKQKAQLCITEDQAVLNSESAKSLVKNSVKSSPSVVSLMSKSPEPGPSTHSAIPNTSSGNHVSEDMDITDSSSNRIEPVSSTDSTENSSPLILVHSRASTSSRATIPAPRITPPAPPAPPTPDPSMSTTTSYTSSSISSSTNSGSIDLDMTTSSSSGGLTAIFEADMRAVEADLMDLSSPPPPPIIREMQGGVTVSNSSVKLELDKEADSPYLSETIVKELIEKAEKTGDTDYRELTNTIWLVFSNPECLNRSFRLPEGKRAKLNTITKIQVDVGAVRRTYETLFNLDLDRITNTIGNAIEVYHSSVRRNVPLQSHEPLSHFVILLENPLLSSPELLKAFSKLLHIVISLPLSQKEDLIRWFAQYSIDELQTLMSSVHQLITLQLLFSEEDHGHRRYYIPQLDPAIASATHTLDLLFFANLIKAQEAGDMKEMVKGLNSVAAQPRPESMRTEDSEYSRMLARLQVHPALVIRWPIDYTEFVNDELNKRVSMSIDYQREFRSEGNDAIFSFLEHPFILSTANKMEKLLRDNLVSMYSERQRAIVHTIITGVPDIPFLILRVGRDDIVSSALVQLEATADLNPIDLRKQLRVEFHGEEGIDEGGLQKEFFQLIVEKLFDPMHGMFIYDEDTQQHWFNPMTFETEQQYKLIGLLLGLAIYNNIILDIRFPVVIYRKLIGCPIQFEDLYSSHPQIAQSLKSMLEFDGEQDEFESTFMTSFEVSFSDMFGTLHTHSLKEGGDKIPVTKDNVKEYVDLYTNWMLNESIESSFTAFKRGFDLVMGTNYLADLFVAEEVEMLICGSQEWDIDALEESTRYDGFNASHPVIVNFWQIVRQFTESQKKQLLAFVTGCDRIPLGGLAKLKFIIVKNGPDSNRLPTAHTCFNALMLCDYSSKQKLEERLTKAISHAKGFGMI